MPMGSISCSSGSGAPRPTRDSAELKDCAKKSKYLNQPSSPRSTTTAATSTNFRARGEVSRVMAIAAAWLATMENTRSSTQ
ncbi:unannotated protein [freshwater metagenome]|uniref:Unannotated protein n=1 Tax=freshwater metagenome TaxID=449393 RepID=A0A6J7RF17_9ZZZZ